MRLAYSGERAAGYAYRGHWRSSRDAGERSRIRPIEDEEWHHRRLVGDKFRPLPASVAALVKPAVKPATPMTA